MFQGSGWEDGRHRRRTPGLRRAGGLLFLAVLLPAAVLHHPATGWNVNSRLALVFAWVDRGTSRIDAYYRAPETETRDVAVSGGHVYSDKVFGVSLLAAPLYAGLRAGFAVFGARPSFQQASWALRVGAVSLPAALAVWLLWRLLVGLGAEPRRALLASACCCFGSLLFGYATVFYPYLPGIAACLAALSILLREPEPALDRRRCAALGGLCGLALLFDLGFAPLVLGLAALFLARVARDGGAAGARREAALRIALFAGAGALCLAPFVVYCLAVFGSPRVPYAFHALAPYREAMARGVLGVTAPSPVALWYLSFHPYRGLFFWSPLLLAALVGCGLGLRHPGARRRAGLLGLYATAVYLLANAGYHLWWGGWAMGPRLLLPLFAALPLGLAELCRPDRPRLAWRATAALGLVSVALSAPLSLRDPQLPQGHPDAYLRALRFGDPLRVPHFDVLRDFYGLAWLRGGDGERSVALSYGAALLLPVLLLARARRALSQTTAAPRAASTQARGTPGTS